MKSAHQSGKLTPLAAFKQGGGADRCALLFATWFGCGLAPMAPGTFGTLGAFPLALGVYRGGVWYGSLLVLVLVAFALWSSGRAATLLVEEDPPPVVIDEAAGLLVTLFLVPPSWFGWTAGFFLFRFFDILKPYPIRRLERIGGGAGIVADDLFAGVYARIILAALLWLTGAGK